MCGLMRTIMACQCGLPCFGAPRTQQRPGSGCSSAQGQGAVHRTQPAVRLRASHRAQCTGHWDVSLDLLRHGKCASLVCLAVVQHGEGGAHGAPPCLDRDAWLDSQRACPHSIMAHSFACQPQSLGSGSQASQAPAGHDLIHLIHSLINPNPLVVTWPSAYLSRLLAVSQ